MAKHAYSGTAVTGKKGLSLTVRNTMMGMSFILPNFIGFFIFILIPVVFSLILSFMDWDGFNAMTFAGLRNFVAIFRDEVFRQSLGRTFVYTISCVVFTLFASLGLAVLLNKDIKAKGFFRSSIFFPYVASIVSIAVVWRLLFMKDMGPINAFLRFVGISNPPGWFGSTTWALPGVIIVAIWKYMGYYMIVYLAALQDIPRELHEAASIDGASSLQYFWRITLPMLAPSTFFVVLMLTINSFKSFDLIFALTEGGPGTSTTLLSNYIYNKAFISFNYGQTSAAAMILFIIVGSITLFQLRLEKKLSR
ncbi:carbohydrate ABC transporter permease [Breznakiella homolactica]|uniref:Sugar ABC transporter permease n=1 Tax=Breznakiella homolactica TaxID=2798577 RepID=A0A7T7XR29_9SPIR|nr:sugar ABC transporter permease [Breznakiella homolactica]QQO10843.1 sugar ABC transporter permease [Breznakiella homolactica]